MNYTLFHVPIKISWFVLLKVNPKRSNLFYQRTKFDAHTQSSARVARHGLGFSYLYSQAKPRVLNSETTSVSTRWAPTAAGESSSIHCHLVQFYCNTDTKSICDGRHFVELVFFFYCSSFKNDSPTLSKDFPSSSIERKNSLKGIASMPAKFARRSLKQSCYRSNLLNTRDEIVYIVLGWAQRIVN